MKRLLTITGIVAVIAFVIVLAGCSGTANAQGGRYAPTTVTATVNGDSVSIPGDVVNSKHNVEFYVKFDQGTASYMAYTFNNAVQVRASVCVPCQGRSFTLDGTRLVCNTCGTIFSAQTGKGISGVPACQNYPKAAVPFTTAANGDITMLKADLLTAFIDTLRSGLP